MPDDSRNEALRELYVAKWPALEEIAAAAGSQVSSPYLAWAHPDYEQADVRLVVVGKETNGWGDHSLAGLSPREAVDTLMGEYRDFALGAHYRGRASFWTPVHELYRRLNPGCPVSGFVALNASVVDAHGSTPDDKVRAAVIRTGLLREELRILDPHVVVFHTGPQYEGWLDDWFPGLRRTGDEWLAGLEAEGLPALSFRTYHPRYLNYHSRRIDIYDRIVDAVRKGAPATKWVEGLVNRDNEYCTLRYDPDRDITGASWLTVAVVGPPSDGVPVVEFLVDRSDPKFAAALASTISDLEIILGDRDPWWYARYWTTTVGNLAYCDVHWGLVPAAKDR